MTPPQFIKLLHAYYPDAGCGSLVIPAVFNNTRCTYRVPTAATQLKYLEPDVFATLSRLGLKFFLGIGPWGVLPELVNRFLIGYNPDTGHVNMQPFVDSPPVAFQFTAADVCATLHLPLEGAPFRTTRTPGVVPGIIPVAYAEYSGREGWRYTEIPLHLHDRCSAIAQIGDTASTDATARITGEYLKWAHDPQPVQWAHELVRRVREWHTRPKSTVNFAWFLTRYLCAKFSIGPPAPPFVRCQERFRKITVPGQLERLRLPERDFLRQVHQGEQARPPAHKQPPITHVSAEANLDTPEDITNRVKEFQTHEFTPTEIQALSTTFHYVSHQTTTTTPRSRSCTTESILRDQRNPPTPPPPTSPTPPPHESSPPAPATTTLPFPSATTDNPPQPRPHKLARHTAPDTETPDRPSTATPAVPLQPTLAPTQMATPLPPIPTPDLRALLDLPHCSYYPPYPLPRRPPQTLNRHGGRPPKDDCRREPPPTSSSGTGPTDRHRPTRDVYTERDLGR